MVAQLPEKCFALVVVIGKKILAGESPQVTKSKAITQNSLDESYELLKSARDGQKTSTKLNNIPTEKVNCSLEHI